MARPSRQSHAIVLTLFLWHMPDDATEGVVKHSSRLQPSINLHAPVTAFMFSCSGCRSGSRQGPLNNVWIVPKGVGNQAGLGSL